MIFFAVCVRKRDRKELVIVCPEQSMWLDYKKPKPFKYGAFKWATENNVPVIPTFITKREPEGNSSQQAYTVNIGEPLYPDESLPKKENIFRMRNLDYLFCRKVYEETYGIPLRYDTIMHGNIPQYVLSTPYFNDSISPEIKQPKRESFGDAR